MLWHFIYIEQMEKRIMTTIFTWLNMFDSEEYLNLALESFELNRVQ